MCTRSSAEERETGRDLSKTSAPALSVPSSVPTCGVPSSVTTGSYVVLTCHDPDGSPPSTYKWFKDEALLPEHPNMFQDFKNFSYILNPKVGTLVSFNGAGARSAVESLSPCWSVFVRLQFWESPPVPGISVSDKSRLRQILLHGQ